MSFEEIIFKKKKPNRPKMFIDEVVLRYSVDKKSYMRFNTDLSEELIKEGFKCCVLEYNKETNELRLKFRKHIESNTLRLCTNGRKRALYINNQDFVKFIKGKLNIEEERTIIHIGENRSNVLTVQTRYLKR